MEEKKLFQRGSIVQLNLRISGILRNCTVIETPRTIANSEVLYDLAVPIDADGHTTALCHVRSEYVEENTPEPEQAGGTPAMGNLPEQTPETPQVLGAEETAKDAEVELPPEIEADITKDTPPEAQGNTPAAEPAL